MKITDNTEKRTPKIDLVNRLLQKSFGKRYKGNYLVEFGLVSCPEGLKEINFLQTIGQKKLFGMSFDYVGEFSKIDGSKINVFPKYIEQAKKYAQLYEKETGKEVEISLVDVL